ncbi:FadR/GntR family transcriptional regulator [Leifsonia aquatica]|uniref:FadR/GntR family transcriptional regulator n=1 Tax=Leifsonia aquatica TaxID=144185 RepID=UPI00046B069A|nr:FadR/GntR family transcriptional regulator [Leifsonia aquatica]
MSSPAHVAPEETDAFPSLAQLDSVSPVSAVANRLLDLFTSGGIRPGTRLPAERALASSLGVGRSAVREAMAALEILGLVDVRAGSGTYLRNGASDLLPNTMAWGLLISSQPTKELLELRCGLEIFAARLATERASVADLEELEREVDAMEASVTDLHAFVRADRSYHRRMLAAAGNSVLTGQINTIHSLLRVWMERAVEDSEQARVAALEHRTILEALRQQDPDAAASAMAVHMDTATARLSAFLAIEAGDPRVQRA